MPPLIFNTNLLFLNNKKYNFMKIGNIFQLKSSQDMMMTSVYTNYKEVLIVMQTYMYFFNTEVIIPITTSVEI